MDDIALRIVRDYISNHIDAPADRPVFVFTVWKSKALQNWKYLISSNVGDGRYYELTYNGDAEEWYLDVYKKLENVVLKAQYKAV